MNQTLTCVTGTPSFDRGREFVSSDSSAVTFWSDTNVNDNATSFLTGNLIFPDGRVYRIEDGSVKWIRDRNGNQIRFRCNEFSRVIQITDSFERDVFVAYGVPCGADNCDEISYTGASGNPRVIRIRVNNLGAAGVLGVGVLQRHDELFPPLLFAALLRGGGLQLLLDLAEVAVAAGGGVAGRAFGARSAWLAEDCARTRARRSCTKEK